MASLKCNPAQNLPTYIYPHPVVERVGSLFVVKKMARLIYTHGDMDCRVFLLFACGKLADAISHGTFEWISSGQGLTR